MAGIIKTNTVQLGDSATATQNFVLQTNVDGTAKLSRGNVGATTADILTVDATGVLSAAGKLMFNRGNILGTVSQAAGVPTGAVVERGSNANGEYVRFADGTQICTRSGFGWAGTNASNAASLPAAFVGNVSTTWNSTPSENVYMVNAVWIENSSWLFRNATASTAQPYFLTALGRWF